MTTKTTNRLKNLLWGVIGTLIGGVLIYFFAYAKNGIVGGNQADEKIMIVDKKIVDHICFHQIFEQSIKTELSKKVDNNRMDRLEETVDRIDLKLDNILLGQREIVKTSAFKRTPHITYGGHDSLR